MIIVLLFIHLLGLYILYLIRINIDDLIQLYNDSKNMGLLIIVTNSNLKSIACEVTKLKARYSTDHRVYLRYRE